MDEREFEISIHTPARGVTGNCHLILLIPLYFNPHSRTGSDISRRAVCDRPQGDFNPHSRTGSDREKIKLIPKKDNFNPHSRTGSDKHPAEILPFIAYFNPHSRTGSDMLRTIAFISFLVFQSTLPHGE